ncbi:coiled-coil domain-containing protein 186-like isoform X2 [Leptopilina heterotoma]|uniref:coiled-coil domain-containing protein 186-like isoform X2 n=1 Tax=Leptopilina heterotoma TaxID=63436 RepID=UPI001CA90155|nr:coiled-coil domain-containing protein 186-like isoform X2 [Leptopilina heterotoma]
MEDNNQVPDKIDKNFEEYCQQLAENSCENEEINTQRVPENEEFHSDDEENETIFKKTDSILLNSLFGESRNFSIDEISNSESIPKEIQDNSVLLEKEDKSISEEINNDDTKSVDDSSPIKNVSIIEKSAENFNNDLQVIPKNQGTNLINEKRKLIPVRNYRPTLSDDSKLVKISLPTNPINLMQSNAQFLNKSKNFFHFITEKSSNIMEKTLLTQNITNRYNSLLKHTDFNVKKQIEESSSEFVSNPNKEMKKTTEEDDKQEQSNEFNKQEQKIQNSNSLCFKDESDLSKTTNELIDNSSTTPDVKFEESERSPEEISHLENFGEKIPDPNTLNLSLLESQENSPRQTSEEDSEAESSMDSGSSKSHYNKYLDLLKNENEKLIDKLSKSEEKNQNDPMRNEEIIIMERRIEILTNELKNALANQEATNREINIANKERECMVMKYAVSEKQLIDVQRARDLAERKLKEISRDHELMQSKLRQSQGERSRICNILDNKCTELVEVQKQVDRLKEDINMKDVKLKWTQNKLKTEMDLQKETQQKLGIATAKINEVKEESELIKRETQETMRKFQQSEENKAVTLDQQLKEQHAQLILERHVTEDKENIRLHLQKEVESLKHRQQILIEENSNLSLKLQDFENDRSSYESSLSNLKSIADQRQKEIGELSSKVAELETLKIQLQHKDQCLASIETEIKRYVETNQDLQNDMESCRLRESQMLEFTQKLTDKNVQLQSELIAIEAKNKRLEHEQGPLHERITQLLNSVKTLELNLAAEEKKRIEDCEILAKHVAEQTKLAQNLSQKLEDSEGENTVLKRKHQLSLKEMTRELQHCRKRLEIFEAASPGSSLDPTSRTGSSTSLNTGETVNGALSDNSNSADHSIQSVDRQSLIEKIIKLQKINVKKAEKIDFLEEHVQSLVAELQKKAKIIQNYILVENFDAMSTNERDRNKAELAKYGGIMASVYSHKVSDDHMTLELSLEINQKLQTVLEDTLLKNITLKDNIDTLGEEIAKLTMQIQQKQNAK